MKKTTFSLNPLKILPILFLISFSIANAQYTETFFIDNKGILDGPCSSNLYTSCSSIDFSGVDWVVNRDLTGLSNPNDFVRTDGGRLHFQDTDAEVCWESPLLDTSGAMSTTITISVGLEWFGQDQPDFIDVEYKVDGGSWVQIPLQFGNNPGGGHTIDFLL